MKDSMIIWHFSSSLFLPSTQSIWLTIKVEEKWIQKTRFLGNQCKILNSFNLFLKFPLQNWQVLFYRKLGNMLITGCIHHLDALGQENLDENQTQIWLGEGVLKLCSKFIWQETRVVCIPPSSWKVRKLSKGKASSMFRSILCD